MSIKQIGQAEGSMTMERVEWIADDSLKALTSGKAKYWMLLVGANRYLAPLQNLQFAARDCQELEKALREATRQFPNKEILSHHDDAEEDSQPEQKSVYQSLKRICIEAKEKDTVLVYFSGHGKVDCQEAFLCFADTESDNLQETGWALPDLLGMLEGCAASKQILILDACHSGSFADVLGTAKGEATEVENTEEAQPSPASELVSVLQEQVNRRSGFCALLSCDKEQKSWEFSDLRHGIFTHHLIEGFQGEAADKDEIIKVTELHEFVYQETDRSVKAKCVEVNRKLEQTPRMIVSQGERIILGLKPEDAYLDPSERRKKYKSEVDRIVKKYGALDAKIVSLEDYEKLNKLKAWLRPLYIQKIEEDAIESHIESVTHFTHKFRDLVSKEHPIDKKTSQGWKNWRTFCEGDLNAQLADDIEKRETEAFEDKLKQSRDAFRAAIGKEDPIERETREQWQQWSKEELGLDGDRIAKIAERAEQEYWENLQQYEENYTQAVHLPVSLAEQRCDELQHRARELGLNRDRVAEINQRVKEEYGEKELKFETAYTQWIYQPHPHDSEEEWQQLQPQRGLHPEKIDLIKQRVRTEFDRNRQQYQEKYIQLIYQQHPLGDTARKQLEEKRESLGLHPDLVLDVDKQVEAGYQNILDEYERDYTQAIDQQYPLRDFNSIKEPLRQRLEYLGINTNSLSILDRETQIEITIETKRQEYQQKYTDAIYREHPLSFKVKQKLEEERQNLGLRSHHVLDIVRQAEAEYQNLLDEWKQDLDNQLGQEYPPSDLVIEEWRSRLENLGINPDSKSVQKRQQEVIKAFEDKLQQYKKEYTDVIHQQANLDSVDSQSEQRLQKLQADLGLSRRQVLLIEEKVRTNYQDKLNEYERTITQVLRQGRPTDPEHLRRVLQKKEDLQKDLLINQKFSSQIYIKVLNQYEEDLILYQEAIRKAIKRQEPLI